MSEADSALVVDGLYKRYGQVHAVNGLSFSAPRGSVLGLLGSNGAGKTTTVRIISTLLPFDTGTVTVLGRDVVADAREVRSRIGLTGQYAALDDYLTGYENLEMIGRLYRLTRGDARRRAAELIELFELTEAGKRLVKTYSGGMRRRLDLAASLIIAPELLILDEPTTGLDPSSRRTVWGLVRDLVDSGTSLLLTTQYLEEAEELADDIVVIDKGAVAAQGSPESLKEQVGGARLEVHLAPGTEPKVALGTVERFGSGPAGIVPDSGLITVPVDRQARLLARVIRALDEEKIDVADVRLREPTLDDVFLTLTGSRSPEPQNA
ncbi:daunorubicin resistance protein DrrA family ABC transporter ATP-binding protein [Nocardiopsis rhodophaea]|uniref:Daunorubicin resistance protein DrrA family ABC transporter ATP-binding protein n=1 Tax=Nocardiopsis rhodophaea TaxID=280238 RepID=A0ABP5F7J5_9ACTN